MGKSRKKLASLPAPGGRGQTRRNKKGGGKAWELEERNTGRLNGE